MRPRKSDPHLPRCIYHRHGAYYLVRRGKWIPLGRDLSIALAEYGRRLETPKGGMGQLIDDAFDAMRSRLSKSTRSQYALAARKLKDILVEFAPDQVKPVHVVRIKNAMSRTPNMANRVLSFLRQVFDYALEQQLIESNPAVSVKRHKEHKRQRLITQVEFDSIYAKAVPRLQVIMGLQYYTGQRISDILRIRVTDLLDEGIRFEQQKTGNRLIVRWTPALRAIVDRAKSLHGNVRALTLLHNRRGKPPDYRTVHLQWATAATAAGIPDARPNDLRAMAITAARRQGQDPTALAGHDDTRTTLRYLRDRETPLVDGPVLDVKLTT